MSAATSRQTESSKPPSVVHSSLPQTTVVRKAGVFADTRVSWSSSVNLTDQLSGFMFHVLYACGHLIEIKEERGTGSREAVTKSRVPLAQHSFRDSLRFLAVGAEGLCDSTYLGAICRFKPGKATSVW